MDESPLLDRAFDQIDMNTARVEKLSEIVYAQSTVLSILSKIVFGLVLAALIGTGSMIFDHIKKPDSFVEHNRAFIEEVVRVTMENKGERRK